MKKSLLEKMFISQNQSIAETMQVIDDGECGIALVVDEAQKLLGVVTDKNIRKALLSGGKLEDSIADLINKDPVSMPKRSSHEKIRKCFLETSKTQIPLLDKAGRVTDLALMNEYIDQPDELPSVMIMAGGKGKRLYPLTLNTPKPLVMLRNKPILERLIEQVKSQGFKKVILSVHHMAEQIENYFRDGSDFGVEISYVKETKPLGTAGSLGFLDLNRHNSVIVMNGDLLTNIDLPKMIRRHQENDAEMTVGVRPYQQSIPFGVIRTESDRITEVIEKPVETYFINAGIYILGASVLKMVKTNQALEMPDLINKVLKRDRNVTWYKIEEYWRDLGLKEELSAARDDLERISGNF